MIQLRILLALGALLATASLAQPPVPPLHAGDTFNLAVPGGPHAGGDFIFVRAGMGMDKLVKGAPYTAQAVTDFTQTLADGNRIHHSNTASLARDSEGRTRREETIIAIGPMAGSGETPKSIFIHDPVARTSYVLEPESHTARQSDELKSMVDKAVNLEIKGAMKMAAGSYTMRAERAQARLHASHEAEGNADEVKTEDLGSQVMEGLVVQGKRTTRIIPAGQIGNDRPIESVTETWYSPELQTTVMSKTNDPRTGEVIYKLTNVSRAEPDPALFQVPADYKLSEDGESGNHKVRVMFKEE